MNFEDCVCIGYKIAKKTFNTIIKNSQDIIKFDISLVLDIVYEFLKKKYKDMNQYPVNVTEYIDLSSITMVCILVKNSTKTLDFNDLVLIGNLSYTPMALTIMENIILFTFGGALPSKYRFLSLDELAHEYFGHVPKIFFTSKETFSNTMISIFNEIDDAPDIMSKIDNIYRLYFFLNNSVKHLSSVWKKFYKTIHSLFPNLLKEENSFESLEIEKIEIVLELIKRDIPSGYD